MNTEDYVTIGEAAISLEVTEGALRKAILLDRLPCTVSFGRKLILKTDLEAYRQRTQPEGEKSKGRPRKQIEK